MLILFYGILGIKPPMRRSNSCWRRTEGLLGWCFYRKLPSIRLTSLQNEYRTKTVVTFA